jgi:hypothetical protein
MAARVTRLSDFSPIGWLFTLGSFFENYECSLQFFGYFFPQLRFCTNFGQKWIGLQHIWVIFFTNSSGHPDGHIEKKDFLFIAAAPQQKTRLQKNGYSEKLGARYCPNRFFPNHFDPLFRDKTSFCRKCVHMCTLRPLPVYSKYFLLLCRNDLVYYEFVNCFWNFLSF